jgi:hypothetical protein
VISGLPMGTSPCVSLDAFLQQRLLVNEYSGPVLQSCGACALWAKLVGGWQKRTLPIVTEVSACDSGMCMLPSRMGVGTFLEKKEWLNQKERGRSPHIWLGFVLELCVWLWLWPWLGFGLQLCPPCETGSLPAANEMHLVQH